MVSNAPPGRIAALDPGEVRTGVAVSDPGRTLARPLEVVPSAGIEDYLRGLVEDGGVEEVLVGVPKTLGGEIGPQAKRVLEKLATLRAEFPAVCFVEWDERFTTRLVRPSRPGARTKGRGGRRKGAEKERVDHLAAAAMLQEYLDRRRPA